MPLRLRLHGLNFTGGLYSWSFLPKQLYPIRLLARALDVWREWMSALRQERPLGTGSS